MTVYSFSELDDSIRQNAFPQVNIAYDVNDSGEVIGFADNVELGGSFGYSNDFVLPALALHSFYGGLNDAGDVVGYYDDDSGRHGFVASNGGLVTLDPGYLPFAINASDEVAGLITGSQIGFTYTTAGGYQQFSPPPSGRIDQIVGISDAGDVYGNLDPFIVGGPREEGFIYRNGGYTIYNAPGADIDGTFIVGMSDNGLAVGWYQDQNLTYHSFYIDANGLHVLANPPGSGATGNIIAAINDKGQIVGTYYDGNDAPHGYVATPDANGVYTYTILPDQYPFPTGINDNGEIVGMYDSGPGIWTASPSAATAALFTDGDDSVDFNAIHGQTAPQAQTDAVNDGADLYHSGGGNDVVVLPNLSSYRLTSTVSWDPAQTFVLGDGNDAITGGDGTDLIQLGAGTDIVDGSPGNDKITGGTGQDTFDYTAGSFQNFTSSTPNGWASGTSQTIVGSHSSFQTTASQQNLLKLPGSPSDYTTSVAFQTGIQFLPDSLGGTLTTFTTTGADGLQGGISIAATDVEKVTFASPINNKVTLTANNVAVEMLQLAADSYGPLPSSPYHLAEPLAYQSNDTSLSAAGAAQQRGWHAVSAMELGIAPADFGQGTLQYSFVNGVYQAINPVEESPAEALLLGGDPSEADALVLSGMVNGVRTLTVVFRGSDQASDWIDYPDFADYYAKFAPLIQGIQAYANDPNNGVQQILVSGHSLGAGAAQYFMSQFPNTSNYVVQAYTDGSPGAEVDVGDSRIENFINSGDVVAAVPSYFGDLSNLIDAGVFPPGLVESVVQTKHHTGSEVIFDNNDTTRGTAEHNKLLYVSNLEKLIAFASDPSSSGALRSDSTVQALLHNQIPTLSIQVAVGTPGSNTVQTYSGDEYVLGYMKGYTPPQFVGDQIDWDTPTAVGTVLADGTREALHVVDGGSAGVANTIVLPGIALNYKFVSVGNGGTDLFYVGPESQYQADGLIGQLFNVQDVSFSNNAGHAPSTLSSLTTANGQYTAGTPGQPLIGGNGPQTLDGSNLQNQAIRAGNGPDTLIGGTNDALSAGNGSDTVVGGANDTITLGNGADTVFGGSNNTITLGNGNDLVVSGDASSITVGNGNDTIAGKDGDIITAKNGNVTIFGADGETISVGNGNDVLTVGDNCTITLGKGNDDIICRPDSGAATTLHETITGLTARDTLDFTTIDFATVRQATFSGSKAGGTLTISDGTHTADIALIGNYLNSSWTLSNDGNGGTTVVDPPGGPASGAASPSPSSGEISGLPGGGVGPGGALEFAPYQSAADQVASWNSPSSGDVGGTSSWELPPVPSLTGPTENLSPAAELPLSAVPAGGSMALLGANLLHPG